MAGATFANVLDMPYHIVGNQRRQSRTRRWTPRTSRGKFATAANLGLSHIDHAEAQIAVAANATDGLGHCQFVRSSGITGQIKLYGPMFPPMSLRATT